MEFSSKAGVKIGWIGGWAGSFLWVAILSVVFFFQAKYLEAVVGALLSIDAFAVSMLLAPWRHPEMPFWKLMLAPYVMFFLAVAWAAESFGAPWILGINWWDLLWIIPMLTPIGVLGNRRWEEEFEGQPGR